MTARRELAPPAQLVVETVQWDGFADMVSMEAPADVRDTLKRIVGIAANAQGRCAFAIASKPAFCELKMKMPMDYFTADKGDPWEDGYMSTRLRGTSVQDEGFAEAVREWSSPDEGSRWPEGHEAQGLSKDGFTCLVDKSGTCLKGAVFILGLPASPTRWHRVGCLHGVALDLCWALRRHHAAVVVRSITGAIHVLLPKHKLVKAFKSEP